MSEYENKIINIIDSDDVEQLAELIANGLDINQRVGYDRSTLLIYSARNGRMSSVHWLLENGADVHLRSDFDCETGCGRETFFDVYNNYVVISEEESDN